MEHPHRDIPEKSLRERTEMYESYVPVEVQNEIPRIEYLKRLAPHERVNLANMFMSFDRLVRVMPGLTALVVGSTTFDETYWEGLRQYLEANDPSKIGYADRRGEDIDIILCSDSYYELGDWSLTECMQLAMRDLREAGINWHFEEDARENGTSYLTVPEEYRQQQGESVIRHKRISYLADTLVITFPEGRNVHLSFTRMLAELKLKHERINDFPFSLLFRGSPGRHDLYHEVVQMNGSDSE